MVSRVATAVDDNAVAGIYGGFVGYRLADPVIVGDISNNNSIDASDVTALNQSLSGTLQTRLPPVPTNLNIAPTGPDPTLSLPSDLRASPGETVMVPVYLDTARPEGSAGLMEAILALKYNPNVFTVSDIHLGTLATSGQGWNLQSSVNQQSGEIGIDLFSSTPITSSAGGSLVTVTFHVLPNATLGASSINLVRSVNPTGQRAFVTTASDAA